MIWPQDIFQEKGHTMNEKELLKSLQGRHILLGVTGGVAAYKAVELASLLQHAGAEVDVVLTPAAQEFIPPLSFAAVTRRPVQCDLFAPYVAKPGHISLAEQNELIIIAPATANTIAKLAAGFADNLLTSSVLASRAPLLLAPAMNDNMWSHPATQENISKIADRGAKIIGPDEGPLACGHSGKGRMVAPTEILHLAAKLLSAHPDA